MFTRSNGLRGNAETAISCRRAGPASKKNEVYQSGGEKAADDRCALAAKEKGVELAWREDVKECDTGRGLGAFFFVSEAPNHLRSAILLIALIVYPSEAKTYNRNLKIMLNTPTNKAMT